jgi:hypothetical protein
MIADLGESRPGPPSLDGTRCVPPRTPPSWSRFASSIRLNGPGVPARVLAELGRRLRAASTPT